jgi:phage baseplate assembly protein gpV
VGFLAMGASLTLAACVAPLDDAARTPASDAGADAGVPADAAAPDAAGDAAPVSVSVRVENRVCPEGNVGESFCSIPVRLSGATDHDVIVALELDSARTTATSGVDFRMSTLGITIPAGQREGEIPVVFIGDRDTEADELVAFRIASVRGATEDIAAGYVTILNDDGASPPVTSAPLPRGRGFHTATALADGRVILVGGVVDGAATSSIDVIEADGSVRAFRSALGAARMRHSATLLDDGRILVVGGVSTASTTPYAQTELIDPALGTVAPGPSLTAGRLNHNAVRLDDGSVLVAGGVDSSAGGSCLATGERFVPRAGALGDRVVATENGLPAASDGMAAIKRSDGSVLFVGGACVDSVKVVRYVPGVGFQREAVSLRAPRVGATVSSLPDGRVFVAGGMNTAAGVVVERTELVDLRTQTSVDGPNLAAPRFAHRAETLADGRVVLSGGTALSGGLVALATVEVFDPATATLRTAFTLREPRAEHATVRLTNRVLHIGGYVSDSAGARSLATYDVTSF